MPTLLFSKKGFIEWVNRQVSEKDVVIVGTDKLSSSIYKKDCIKVEHIYARDCIQDEGIGHIAFNATPSIGILIMDKKRLSAKGKEVWKEVYPAKPAPKKQSPKKKK